MWQPGWEGNLGENGHMDMYGWVPLLFTWNRHNIVCRWDLPQYTAKKKFNKIRQQKILQKTAVRLFMGSADYSSVAKVLHLIKETLRSQKNLHVCSKITEETSFTHTAQSTPLNGCFWVTGLWGGSNVTGNYGRQVITPGETPYWHVSSVSKACGQINRSVSSEPRWAASNVPFLKVLLILVCPSAKLLSPST